VLAVAVPAAALHFGAADERTAAGLTAPPFGWPRVLVAHLVTALPLGLLLAGRLRTVPAVKESARGLWAVAGLAVAGLAVPLSAALGEAVDGGTAGAAPLLALRAALAVALVLPWCVWLTDAAPPAGAGLRFGLAAAAALVPCALYADGVAAARTEQAADLFRRGRLVRADAVLAGLVELGGERPVQGKPPAEVRRSLASALPRLRQRAAASLPPTAPPAARLDRAVLMIQLERPADAAALLEPLEADHTAALLLASVYRDQERWAESDARFERVLAAALPRAADPVARADALTALEGLAFNARADGRPADAERVLTRGLEALPDRAALFHFQLGRHYHDGGQSGRALAHLREAARLDPAEYGEPAARLIRQIQSATPACLSWPR
jgi:tetratricopeptide (TPR) repeat protein